MPAAPCWPASPSPCWRHRRVMPLWARSSCCAGTGSAVQHPIASTLISKAYAAASRRAALGVYNFVGDVGKMVVAAAIGLGIVAIGWRSSVALYGLIVVGVGAARSSRSPAPLAFRAARTLEPAGNRPGWGFTDPHRVSRCSAADPAHRQRLPHGVPHLLPVPADRQGRERGKHRLRPLARLRRRRRGQAGVRAARRARRHPAHRHPDRVGNGRPDRRGGARAARLGT